jgi:hypothetical protein
MLRCLPTVNFDTDILRTGPTRKNAFKLRTTECGPAGRADTAQVCWLQHLAWSNKYFNSHFLVTPINKIFSRSLHQKIKFFACTGVEISKFHCCYYFSCCCNSGKGNVSALFIVLAVQCWKRFGIENRFYMVVVKINLYNDNSIAFYSQLLIVV